MEQTAAEAGKRVRYDLEERTFRFAVEAATFCRELPSSAWNVEYVRQLIRSSGSVGANYIEANEALGRKDFVMKMRIARKEAKESAYWLRLIGETNEDGVSTRASGLRDEAIELKLIFSSILNNLK